MRSILKTMIVLLCVLGFSGLENAFAESKGVVQGSNVNCRSGPGKEYSVLFQLNQGDEILIHEENGGWLHFTIGEEEEGWINSQFVKVIGDSAGQTGKSGTKSLAAMGNSGPAQSSGDSAYEITGSGIGPIKLGMTLDEAKKAISGAVLERTSDGDGASLVEVKVGKDSVMILYAGEEDPAAKIDWKRKIEFIETLFEGCSTSDGIHPGILVSDAEKVFGKVVKITKSEIESREYIEFAKPPIGLGFRLDYTGIFPEGTNETTKFPPEGKIYSISVSTPPKD